MNREATINEKDLSLVGHVKVSLVAEVGQVDITVDELFALKKHDMVNLNQASDAVITLLLNGKPVARGELVAVDDHLGVRIIEMV